MRSEDGHGHVISGMEDPTRTQEMTCIDINTSEYPHSPAALRINVLRAGLGLAIAVSLFAFVLRAAV